MANNKRIKDAPELLDNAAAQQLLCDGKYQEFIDMVDAKLDSAGYFDFTDPFTLDIENNRVSCMLYASSCTDPRLWMAITKRIAFCGGLSIKALFAYQGDASSESALVRVAFAFFNVCSTERAFFNSLGSKATHG